MSKPTLSQNNDRLVVATSDLAEVVKPRIKRLQELHEGKPGNEGWEDKDKPFRWGAFAELSTTVSAKLQAKEESIPRRIYSITNCETIETHIDIADAFLLGLDLNLQRDTDIPVLPGSKATALQMAQVHFPNDTPTEQAALAKKLWRFCRGYLEGSTSEETREHLERARELRYKSHERVAA